MPHDEASDGHEGAGVENVLRSIFTWPLPLSAVWIVLPVAGILLAATIEPIPPYDYWWHLTFGRLIDATSSIPTENLFLYTLPADTPFHDQPWLGQWIMWRAYEVGSHAAAVMLRNVLLVAAWVVLVWVALRRSRAPALSGTIALIGAATVYPVLTVRTRMFAFVPFAVLIWCLWELAEGRGRRRAWLLVPLTAFWANTHGTFVLAPVLVAVVGVGTFVDGWLRDGEFGGRRDIFFWCGLFVGVAAAGLLTPYGVETYVYVVELAVTSNVSSTVSEWMPPDPSTATGMVFGATLIGSLVVLALRRRNVRVWEALLFAATLYLAAGAVRNLFWWTAVVICVVTPHAAALVRRGVDDGGATTTRQGLVHAALLVAICGAALGVQPGLAHDPVVEMLAGAKVRLEKPGRFYLSHETPMSAVRDLEEASSGRVFHDQGLGGLLEFHLTDAENPRPVAYVDQRMELIPERVWNRYFRLSSGAKDWEAVVREDGIEAFLLSPSGQWALVQKLAASDDWRLASIDQSHLLFLREEED